MKQGTSFLNLLTLFVACTLWLTSCQKKADDSKEVAEEQNEEKFETRASENDAEFIVDATASNYAEIKLAQLAQQKSNSQEVKSLAQTMEADHTALLNEVKQLASAKTISIPSAESDEARNKAEKLAEEKDADKFNEKLVEELKDEHEKAIKKFEKAAEDAVDADIKNWATATLPKLREHLDHINHYIDMNKKK